MAGRRGRLLICVVFIVAVAFLVLATPAFAAGPGWTWQNGTFTALEGTADLPNVAPLGISPEGSYVVGYGVGTTPPVERALVWHNGTVTELGTLGLNTSSASGVNDAGHAVGAADVAYNKPVAVLFTNGHPGFSHLPSAFNWALQHSTVNDLKKVTLLRAGDAYSVANAINNYDLVVGDAKMTDGHTWAFAWHAGTMTELPHLPGWNWSTAYDVNDSGQIVGMAVLTDGTTAAVEWSIGGVVVLPGLPLAQPRSIANSINERGDIAGVAVDSNGDGHAVVWSKVWGTNWSCKAVGGPGSGAMGINNAGHVVGTARNTSPSTAPLVHAFLYRNNGMIDLGTLLPWLTSEATAISNQNIVIGSNDYV